jgi:hypothetical protein
MLQDTMADALLLAALGEEEQKHQTSPSSPMFSEEELEAWEIQVSERIETFEVSMQ